MSEIIQPSRRGFLTGLGAALITAPAIVRAGSLMPVKMIDLPCELYGRSPMLDAIPSLQEWDDQLFLAQERMMLSARQFRRSFNQEWIEAANAIIDDMPFVEAQ